MTILRLTISLVLIAYSVSCDSTVKSTSVLTPEPRSPVVLRPIRVEVAEGDSIRSTQLKIGHAKDFSGAYFVNADKGWAFGNKALFVTSDAGQNWKQLPQVLAEEARLSSIFFVDENTGWLIRNVRVLSREPYALGNSSTILFTSDGGNSWVEQATFGDGVQIDELKFLDRDHGLAVGSRIKDRIYEATFVAKTTDGGRSWIDITNKITSADIAGRMANGRGRDVHWVSANSIFMLISGQGGRIITTSDGGENWKTLVQFEDERPEGFVSSVSYYKLAMDPEHRPRVLAGATGDEGYWADMVVPGDQNTWNSYELRGMPMFDAVSLSESEIVMCGRQLHRVRKDQAPQSLGLILYSSDSGKSWKRLYLSKAEETFVSLTRIGDNEFYAVSDAGTFLRFELNKN